ncbi:unnamed protein product, partial [Porites evermanni]
PQTFHSPLDRRAIELSENLKLLEVQVQSAKSHLQGKQKVLDDLPKAHERRGKVCAICHTSGHNRAKCNESSFFAIMRPRLRKQNPAKYLERSALDRDLMIYNER